MNVFDIWNDRKKVVEGIDRQTFLFSEREIWWCVLGKNIGDEQDGKHERFERPVLVLRKFSIHTAVVIPLTTQGKSGSPFYYELASGGNSFVVLSQIRLISTKRLLRKMYRLGRGEFKIVKDKVVDLIFAFETRR